LLEADERERRGPRGRFYDQIDVGVEPLPMTSDRPEDRQPCVSVVSGKGFEDRRGGFQKDLGVDIVEFRSGLELLADGRLGDVEGTADLAFARPRTPRARTAKRRGTARVGRCRRRRCTVAGGVVVRRPRLPGLSVARTYRRAWLRRDLVAGVVLTT